MLDGFYRHLPSHQRADFRASVLARLSGHPADFAVRAAIVAAAIELGFTIPQLRALGFDLRNENRHFGRGSKEMSKEAIA